MKWLMKTILQNRVRYRKKTRKRKSFRYTIRLMLPYPVMRLNLREP